MNNEDYLKYINYSFRQDERFLKVNTDTVALGMFLDLLYNKTVLDIGTNTGALLLYAHYHKAGKLIGVDIHEDALEVAKRNLSAYTENFEFHCTPIQQYQGDEVDVIVCNPPFFENNYPKENENLKEAMFEDNLSLDDLFAAIRKNMKHNGEAYLIYSADRFPELFSCCQKYKLKIMKMQFVHDERKQYASRVLVKLKVGPMTKLHVLKPIRIIGNEMEI